MVHGSSKGAGFLFGELGEVKYFPDVVFLCEQWLCRPEEHCMNRRGRGNERMSL